MCSGPWEGHVLSSLARGVLSVRGGLCQSRQQVQGVRRPSQPIPKGVGWGLPVMTVGPAQAL